MPNLKGHTGTKTGIPPPNPCGVWCSSFELRSGRVDIFWIRR
jgi:hypothetical protein